MVAGTNTTVLITGETGTGKELVARAIHDGQPAARAAVRQGQLRGDLRRRCSRASCSATRRARSPARSSKRKGRFELAHGGTLFLDEIGELPLRDAGQAAARAAGARVRARRRHRDASSVDVRVIAATNRDLRRRWSRRARSARTSTTASTSSRSRCRRCASARDDIPLLVAHFLRRFARQAGKRIDDVAPEAMWRLLAYDWPGNVRELQNVIERAVVLARGNVLDLDALPDLSAAPSPVTMTATAASPTARATADHRRGGALVRRAGADGDPLGDRGRARRGPPARPAPEHAALAPQALGRDAPAERELNSAAQPTKFVGSWPAPRRSRGESHGFRRDPRRCFG